jgi:hypothetical protein
MPPKNPVLICCTALGRHWHACGDGRWPQPRRSFSLSSRAPRQAAPLPMQLRRSITVVRINVRVGLPSVKAKTMKRTKHPTKATLDRTPDTTGRDGAIDFVAKVESSEPVILNQRDDRFTRVMGSAVIDLWGNLPKDIQERLFERAVVLGHQGERDEMLREQLAKYLHDRHKRTAGNVRQKR